MNTIVPLHAERDKSRWEDRRATTVKILNDNQKPLSATCVEFMSKLQFEAFELATNNDGLGPLLSESVEDNYLLGLLSKMTAREGDALLTYAQDTFRHRIHKKLREQSQEG
jgi:hypothetical protein